MVFQPASEALNSFDFLYAVLKIIPEFGGSTFDRPGSGLFLASVSPTPETGSWLWEEKKKPKRMSIGQIGSPWSAVLHEGAVPWKYW